MNRRFFKAVNPISRLLRNHGEMKQLRRIAGSGAADASGVAIAAMIAGLHIAFAAVFLLAVFNAANALPPL